MRRRAFYVSTVLLALMLGSMPAQDTPVKIPNEEVWPHKAGLQGSIHVKKIGNYVTPVALEVIVSPDGRVESAKVVSGASEYFEQAEQIELKRRFKPFLREDEPVRAILTDYVTIVPPEERGDKVPFPPVTDMNSLRMKLQRTTCFGTCPDYSVEVRGSGEVLFFGQNNTLISGHHRGHISQESVGKLLAGFKRADYLSLKDRYHALITDNPTYTTSIEFDGVRKEVVDYVGISAGMPEVVKQLENAIDEIAGTDKWVNGSNETGPALLAEHWDFKADTEENRTLYANVVARGSPELVRLFTQRGAPALKVDKQGQGALVSAARRGNVELMQQMIGDAQNLPEHLLTCALDAAAASGIVEAVELLLNRGAAVNAPPCDPRSKMTPLLMAAQSGRADVVAELLSRHADPRAASAYQGGALALYLQSETKAPDSQQVMELLMRAGADINARDESGRTPIFAACSQPESVVFLARAGADLNAKDQNGQTPLMSCFDTPYLKAMIAAGADLSITNPQGRTAAQEARAMGAVDKADLLDAALKKTK